MTIQELIYRLSQYPSDDKVVIEHDGGWYDIDIVDDTTVVGVDIVRSGDKFEF